LCKLLKLVKYLMLRSRLMIEFKNLDIFEKTGF